MAAYARTGGRPIRRLRWRRVWRPCRFSAAARLAHDDEDIAVLGELLSPQTPAVLQEGVVAALGKLRQPKVADVLLARWRSVGPALRSSILDVLISRDDWTADLLDHIEKKQINVARNRHRPPAATCIAQEPGAGRAGDEAAGRLGRQRPRSRSSASITRP